MFRTGGLLTAKLVARILTFWTFTCGSIVKIFSTNHMKTLSPALRNYSKFSLVLSNRIFWRFRNLVFKSHHVWFQARTIFGNSSDRWFWSLKVRCYLGHTTPWPFIHLFAMMLSSLLVHKLRFLFVMVWSKLIQSHCSFSWHYTLFKEAWTCFKTVSLLLLAAFSTKMWFVLLILAIGQQTLLNRTNHCYSFRIFWSGCTVQTFAKVHEYLHASRAEI